MNIEVGKTYLTRDGRKAFITIEIKRKHYPHLFEGAVESINEIVCFDPDTGGCSGNSNLDLVEEYIDPEIEKLNYIIEKQDRRMLELENMSAKLKKSVECLEEIANIQLYWSEEDSEYTKLARKTLKEIGEIE